MKNIWVLGLFAALAIFAGPREAGAGTVVANPSDPTIVGPGTLNGSVNNLTLTPVTSGFTIDGHNVVTSGSVNGSEIQYAFTGYASASSLGLTNSDTNVTISGSDMFFLPHSTPTGSTVQLDVYGFWTTTPGTTSLPSDGAHFTFGPAALTDSVQTNVTPTSWTASGTSTPSGTAYLEMLFIVDWKNVDILNTLDFDPPTPTIQIQAGPQAPLETPEPSTMAMGLMATVGVGYAGLRKRRRRRSGEGTSRE